MNISKITLGTAQIGFDYGIANKIGKPEFQTSMEILHFAYNNGINTFDTAPDYGNSEEIIGKFISSKIKNQDKAPIIISKMPPFKPNQYIDYNSVYNYIKNQINKSISSLNLKSIPIYLIHHAKDILFRENLIIECLEQIKKEGLINRFGVSVYNPKEVERLLKFKDIDVIQVPINIFDRRMITTKLLKKLKQKNYIIFARSIYLQGLFFIPPEKLPKHLEMAKEYLVKLGNIANEYNIDIAKLALLFVRDLPEIDSLVIGAEKVEQLKDNLNIINEDPLDDDLRQLIMEEFSEIPEKIINPSLWNH